MGQPSITASDPCSAPPLVPLFTPIDPTKNYSTVSKHTAVSGPTTSAYYSFTAFSQLILFNSYIEACPLYLPFSESYPCPLTSSLTFSPPARVRRAGHNYFSLGYPQHLQFFLPHPKIHTHSSQSFLSTTFSGVSNKVHGDKMADLQGRKVFKVFNQDFIVDERYNVTKELGQGAYGIVW